MRNALLLLALITAATADAEPKVELYDYEVRKGDTCVGIAIRELGDRKGYRVIHEHNRLGPLPHNLRPGQILKLPRTAREPDGLLGDKKGAVEVRTPAKEWSRASRGMDLYRYWRVGTKEEATAAIDFRDRSQLRMRERTIVILYGPSKSKARRITENAFLETGALRTRLVDQNKPFMIASAAAMAEFGRGSAVIGVDAKKVARVANHGGKGIKVRSQKVKGEVEVQPGYGTKVEQGKAPSQPRPLPAPPTFAAPARVFPSLAGSGRLVTTWGEVPGASRFRVVVTRDRAGDDPVAVGETGAADREIAVDGLPVGRYYVWVSTIDDEGFEGIRSKPFRAELVAIDGSQPAELGDALLALTSPGAPIEMAPRTALRIPPTVSCILRDGNNVMQPTALPDRGKVRLECLDGRGDPLPEIAIHITN